MIVKLVIVPFSFKFELQQSKISMEHIALPPNAALQLTCQPVTPFAKRSAKGAPLCHAGELGR